MTRRTRQRGLGMITAIVILVLLAGLGAAIVSLTQMVNRDQTLDILGSRALMAARAGVEWQSWLILNPEDSNTTVAPYTTRYACPAVQPQSQIFSGLPDFTVSVTCISESIDEDSNSTPVTVFVYRVVAVACNKPVGGSCPNNSAPGGAYVERSVRVLLETCRQTASGASC